MDIVQLRQKDLEAADELAALEVFAAVAARHDALLAVNDRADVAFAAGADVLHRPARPAGAGSARDLRPGHRDRPLDALVQPGQRRDRRGRFDYFCVGPCWETPTKPGRTAAGLDVVSYAAAKRRAKPWFAIGGIDLGRLDQVLEAGAHRVVVVRAITEADDPEAAAAEFARRLREASE